MQKNATIAMSAFVPAKDFKKSREFYSDIGFSVVKIDENLCEVRAPDSESPQSFFLQNFYNKELAENLMMRLLITNMDAWWDRVGVQRLVEEYGITPPRPPKPESSGLRVSYFWDPSEVLWCVAAAK